MQQKNKYIISTILYPLLVLLLINCPIKQEIKQQLGIPFSSQTAKEKPNQTRSCIVVLQKTKEASAQERYPDNSRKTGATLSFLYSFTPLSTIQYSLQPQAVNVVCRAPLFILFRTLLI